MTKFIPKWTQMSIKLPLQLRMKISSEKYIMALEAIGQQFVADARTSGSYKDRTGNLRSSIGYAIFNNGAEVKSYFEEAQNGGNEGVNNAKRVARENSKGKGIVLIVTAGMDYAGYVEAKGYDVLTIFAPSQSQVELKLRNLLKYV